jgi:hypothetical protein
VTALLRAYQDGRKAVGTMTVAMSVRDEHDQIAAADTKTVRVDAFAAAARQVESSAAPASPSPGVRPPTNIKGLAPSPTPPAAPSDQFANLALRSADVRYELPIDKLPVGAYLLAIEARSGSAVITRTVQFRVVSGR